MINMTSKQRVLRALEFRTPDRVPVDVWLLPAAYDEHGDKLRALTARCETDICGVCGPLDMGANPAYYAIGEMVDEWGNGWCNIKGGIIGEVKRPALADIEAAAAYKAPTQQLVTQWEEQAPRIAQQIDALHAAGKFVTGGGISLFERMQYLRGTEELYCDIACEEEAFFTVAKIVFDFYKVYLDHWLQTDVDGVGFGDDWGSQRALLIAPDTWRRLFKPMYKELIDRIRAAGKKVFFHSDGCIMDLYPDLIEMGVDAVNSQLWCMDIEEIARRFAGKITFWGEISRQNTIPFGTPQDIAASAQTMKHLFSCGGAGGLIGQGEISHGVPFENVEALFTVWNG